MLRVAFAGTPEFAVPTLRALLESPHAVVGVLTQPDRPAGRGRELKASPVKQLAHSAGVPVAQPPSLRSETDRAALVSWQPDVLVVVAYGLILPTAVLGVPRLGGINVHASLLPRWRGAAPVQRAILAGDSETGVSIMQMEAGLDTGPVFEQRRLALKGCESAQQLLAALSDLGAAALIDTLEAVEGGNVSPKKQSFDGVTYAAKLDKREAQIDWQADAPQIARQVRAFNPWPVAHTLWEGQRLRVWQAVAVPTPEPDAVPGQILAAPARLLVQCGQGALSIERVQLAGRRAVRAREFAGGRTLAGARLG